MAGSLPVFSGSPLDASNPSEPVSSHVTYWTVLGFGVTTPPLGLYIFSPSSHSRLHLLEMSAGEGQRRVEQEPSQGSVSFSPESVSHHVSRTIAPPPECRTILC